MSQEWHPPRGSQSPHEPRPPRSAGTHSASLPWAGHGNTYRIVHYDEHRCLRTSRRTPSRSCIEKSEGVLAISRTSHAATATNDNATTNGAPERDHAQRHFRWSSWALDVSPYSCDVAHAMLRSGALYKPPRAEKSPHSRPGKPTWTPPYGRSLGVENLGRVYDGGRAVFRAGLRSTLARIPSSSAAGTAAEKRKPWPSSHPSWRSSASCSSVSIPSATTVTSST